ncbi:AOX1 Alternative oxidase 1 [Candida maltosa Xu316]|uniref:Alternative oxidase n=1 Tax=Candida maltosa (strain Xu316) TaxID=1245528 RepID=M3IT13_CANMX|nr:Alternative oxidase [Candida maltosa Xu316]
MIAASTYKRIPNIISRTSVKPTQFIRLVTTTKTPPSSSPTGLGNPSPKAVPIDKEDTEAPGFIKAKRAPFGIETKVYNNEGIEAQDDDKFLTPSPYPHPDFTEAGVYRVKFTHRPPVTVGDKVSYYGTMFCRKCFDFVTGYAVPPKDQPDKYIGTRWEMTEGKWMTRCIFLEAVAGIPGSVAGLIRHLHSLRMLTRDKAWIQTLNDEAYNERMHLLTFIKIGKPSWFTRTIIYVGQGVFTNLFFMVYLMNPKYCHRFVGYLEEEAVRTYTHLLAELNVPGKLPDFEKMIIPTIAVQYWDELTPESSFKDLILRIRADESKHREINHTFANLEQYVDRNPFALEIKGLDKPQPNNNLDVVRPEGWERKDLYL